MIYGVDLGMRSLYIMGRRATLLTVDKSDRYHEIHELAEKVSGFFNYEDDMIFYEEPVLAGPKNIRTVIGLAQSSAALLAGSSSRCYEVPVNTWKKVVIGKGNADKVAVAEWLYIHHRATYDLCKGDQNFMDAACIQRYGIEVVSRLSSPT